MKTIFTSFILTVFMLTGNYAQTQDESLKGKEASKQKDELCTDNIQKASNNYRDSIDTEFSTYLLNTWNEFIYYHSIIRTRIADRPDSVRKTDYSSLFNWFSRIDHKYLFSSAEFNVIALMKEEYDKMIKANYERSIAGLFVAISLMKNNQIILSGKLIQEAFNKYNPTFKREAPKCFESLGRINILKNDQWVIVLTTTDKNPIVIDKLKINNDTRMKFSTLPDGDVRIDFLEGVKVGKAIIWFPLNYIRLSKATGNILFDYDDDHTQITMNLKNDLMF